MQNAIASFLALGIVELATPAFAQLDRCLAAQWRSFGGVEYDLTWKSAKGVRKHHQLSIRRPSRD